MENNNPVSMVQMRGRGRGVLSENFLNATMASKNQHGGDNQSKGRGVMREIPKKKYNPHANPNVVFGGCDGNPTMQRNIMKNEVQENIFATDGILPTPAMGHARMHNFAQRDNMLPAGAAKPSTVPLRRFPPRQYKNKNFPSGKVVGHQKPVPHEINKNVKKNIKSQQNNPTEVLRVYNAAVGKSFDDIPTTSTVNTYQSNSADLANPLKHSSFNRANNHPFANSASGNKSSSAKVSKPQGTTLKNKKNPRPNPQSKGTQQNKNKKQNTKQANKTSGKNENLQTKRAHSNHEKSDKKSEELPGLMDKILLEPPIPSRKKQETRSNSNDSLMKVYQKQYPWLYDKEFVSYTRNLKIMYIMRGLPGSGKSTIASLIALQYPANCVAVCSADNYRYDESGNYAWSPETLHETHQLCQQDVTTQCQNSKNIIIVDNTNIRLNEFNIYLSLAHKHGYKIILLETTEKNPNVLSRNQHNVPAAKINKMKSSFEVAFPRYLCWSLSVNETQVLKDYIQRYLKELTEIPEFMSSMSKNMRSSDDIFNVYSTTSSTSHENESHVTAAYFEKKQTPKEKNLLKKKYINDAIGTLDKIQVTGFAITARSIFARVTLTKEQKQIWARHDSITAEQPQYFLEQVFHAKKTTSVPFLNEVGLSVGDFRNVDITQFFTNFPKNYFIPNYGVGSTAHITLGVKSPMKPVEGRNDLIRIVIHEMSKEILHSEETEEFLARKYGDNLWSVYFKSPIELSAFFCAYYR